MRHRAHIARIPVGNLRVPRAQFAAIWIAAEERCHAQSRPGVNDWDAGAIATTCAWIAGAVIRLPKGRPHLAYSPVTGRSCSAYEELIEAEYLAAESLDLRQPDLLVSQPGWCEGIRATLRGAWRHAGPPPLPLPEPFPEPFAEAHAAS